MRFVEPLVRPADDGTRVMGSPTTSLVWGRVTQVLGSNLFGSSYVLRGDEVILGREKGEITFPTDRYMSGRHGSVTRRVDGYFLNDLGSSNGTFVRLKGAQPVRPGQYIVAGKQLLRFES
jgi:pSer/pThr/pTyr-binding forkhead associated (FHA) protein